MKPNPQWWQVFLNEYLKNGGNGTQAYLKAKPGCTARAASVSADRVLRNANFIQLYEKATQELSTKLSITQEQWIKKMTDSCLRDFERIEETYTQLEPAADPVAVKCLTQARKTVDDIMRRALCIQDTPVAVEHSGSVDFKFTQETESYLKNLRKQYPLFTS